MKRLLMLSGSVGGCLLTVCLCLALISVPGCANFVQVSFGGDNDYDPPNATCANAGITYPTNPFSGWPQEGRSWESINYYYCAEDYYREFGRTHWGIDIDAHHREPVYATAAATVAWAYHDLSYGMGKTVKICTAGWCATYMHLDEWVVVAGQRVNHGELLGYADNTGFSTGTHLHYQINNPQGQPVDPAPTLES